MSIPFRQNYFMASIPNITRNPELREPQIESYIELKKYFESDYSNRNALIILPTGVGKTGLMGIAPYGIAKKRVLIITPGTTIRNTVLENLNPMNYKNFWLKRKVFNSPSQLPNVIEYEGFDTPDEVLYSANIVILNVHKLQSRLESSLTRRVESDFFDFIIIDEAHHSAAETWVECIKFFNDAKVLKVTGTPIRTDNEPINGELVYKYPLSRAMVNNYAKSLQNIKYIPEDLRLTMDDDDIEYSIDEIYSMNLKDSDWVTKSIAYSIECSKNVVSSSIELLNKKLQNSKFPHKIIAIACSIKHAKQISKLYEDAGINTALIYSTLPKEEKDQAFKDIENDRVQAVINVAMLGEGYDHPYLSVAAIFRPFRNELPYAQFIGRVLRYIEGGTADDNIAQIVSHKDLELDKLWEKYKVEIQESEIIKILRNYDEILDNDFDTDGSDNSGDGSSSPIRLGDAKEYGSSSYQIENYLDTELIHKSEEESINAKEKIKTLSETLNITEEQAELLYVQSQNQDSILGRPDLLYKNKKRNLDEEIREVIVPKLIKEFNIDKQGDDLKDCNLFEGKYWYIPNKVKENAAMLALYLNTYLKNKIGRSRKDWTDSDFNNAFIVLPELTDYIEKIINEYYN